MEVEYEEDEYEENEQPRNISLENNKEENLLDACKKLDIIAIKNLIKDGADVNALQQERKRVSCGPACDGYEIIEYSILNKMLTTSKEQKEKIEKLKKQLAEEKEMAALSPEEWNAKYGDCIVCGDFDPKETAKELAEEIEKEKNLSEIIELLKIAGAKDISQKIM